jgi:hypothetical protein
MLSPRLLLPGLVALLPALGHAQAPALPVPRYYVGLAAYSSAYQQLGGGVYRTTRLPFQVSAGYQVRPRLAVQLGVAYSSASYDNSGSGRYFPYLGPAGGVYQDYSYRGADRSTSLALLARYTLTRHLGQRVQVDALGGVTVEASHYTLTNAYSDSSQVPVTHRYEGRGTDWGVLLTAGPSVRCRLAQHVDALLDFTLNYNLNRGNSPGSSLLTGATALGLRYRFGRPN